LPGIAAKTRESLIAGEVQYAHVQSTRNRQKRFGVFSWSQSQQTSATQRGTRQPGGSDRVDQSFARTNQVFAAARCETEAAPPSSSDSGTIRRPRASKRYVCRSGPAELERTDTGEHDGDKHERVDRDGIRLAEPAALRLSGRRVRSVGPIGLGRWRFANVSFYREKRRSRQP